MKISIIDSWKFKFSQPIVDYWRAQGHDVLTNMNWGPDRTPADSRVCYFPVVDNNLRQASRKQEPSPHRFVVAEAVDIDIYAGNLNGVNWEYVNALIFMARHMKEYGLKKAGNKIPKDLSIYIVPGGVDLDAWTYRRNLSRGYNIAWIGRKWIAKNIFGAIQIFNQLVKVDPGNPWKLFLRADPAHFKQAWWGNHIHSYIEANDRLKGRIEWVPWVDDLNEWLEDKSFLLQTSFKEALGYCVVESAAKGVKPLVQMTNGALDTWPSSWVFQTHDEAVDMFLSSYEPETYRAYIGDVYPLSRRCEMLDKICGLN